MLIGMLCYSYWTMVGIFVVRDCGKKKLEKVTKVIKMIDAIAGYIGIFFLYMLLFRIIDIKAKRAKEKRRNEIAWNWHKVKGKERQIP